MTDTAKRAAQRATAQRATAQRATGTKSAPRTPLNRERVMRAAVDVADSEGISAVSMRRIGQELAVEAMSLYNHVAGKEALLDAMVDQVAGELLAAVDGLESPDPAVDWQGALRARALAARTVMLRHPWAPGVLETRTTMSLDVVRYFDGVVSILRASGFSNDLAHHSLHALGSRVIGFSQELFDPGDTGSEDASEEMLAAMATQIPHLVEMLGEVAHDEPGATLGWCDDQTEFEFGLDVVLDGLERRRASTVVP
ncbi:DNA-binding transcriptional regulator, AcrR family [Pedococcus dokdonensis]|uniref:DNA-binding transcriptional regulator, AcrR family n=1 Tax=Pedococcus dokdonensis TaxID=443156 RepID=A0A1H0UP93_9MICO|nr:TetR/AcrR family transcriptional regulator [Pedococcus dokdonensis]SDP68092.1 DNA-binding transcriptional regulator, AcrR family [Pedococcus dokdonensis]